MTRATPLALLTFALACNRGEAAKTATVTASAPPAVGNAARGPALAAMRGHWWLAVAVGLLSPLSYILVLAALEMGAPLSGVAPTREMSMMVGALFGLLILRERVGPGRAAGCVLVVLGVVLLSGAW